MKCQRPFLWIICILLGHVSVVGGQTEKAASPATAPPRLLLLVHQQFKFGSESTRQKLEASIARACNHLEVPNAWIDLQSMTGPPEALSFDPFESFEHVENAYVVWAQFFTAHTDLARLQEQILALESSESTIIAVRRDDLGYRVNRIDLSKAHFMRILEVRLRPGYEGEFVESFKLLSAAYERIDADMPWVVYQASVGMPSPAFFVFVPMRELRENDSYLARAPKLREAEGEAGFGRMQQIAREAYVSAESNLYAISPGTSHVPKEIIDGDPDFWLSKPSVNANHAPAIGIEQDSRQRAAEANPKL